MSTKSFSLRRLVLFGALVAAVGAAVGQVAAQTPSPSLVVVIRGDKAGQVLAIIDPVAGKIVDRVILGSDPSGVAISADGRLAYVGLGNDSAKRQEDGDAVAIVDIAARKELRRIKIGDGVETHELREAGGKVYFTANGWKAVGRVDPTRNRVDWLVGLGQSGPHMMAVTRDQNIVIGANPGSDTISIVDNALKGPGNWTVTHVPVGKIPEALDISPDQREAWVTSEGSGGVTIVDLAKKAVVASVELQTTHANRLRFTPDGRRVLIVDRHTGEMVIVDAAARKLIKKIKMPDTVAASNKNQVMDLAVQSDGSRAYITVNGAPGRSYIGVIDLKTLEVARRIELGSPGDSMGWAQPK